MDVKAYVCNLRDRLIAWVCVRSFVPNRRNNFASNDHLNFYELMSRSKQIIVDSQVQANHDNHVELYYDQEAQKMVHEKEWNHESHERIEEPIAYQSP